jgi:predicted Rossmann fold nucleotide-binding protein DprA/Smf involved in DNA uptake
MLRLSSQNTNQRWTYNYRQAQQGPMGFPDVKRQYTDPPQPECRAPTPGSPAHKIIQLLQRGAVLTSDALSEALQMPMDYVDMFLNKLEQNGCVSRADGNSWALSEVYESPHKPPADF